MPTARRITLPILIALVALLAALLAAAPVPAQKRPADFPWIGGESEIPELPDLLVGPGELPDGALILTAPLRTSEPDQAPDDGCVARGVFCVRQRLARLGLSGEETIVVAGDDPAEVGRLFWLLEWSGFSGVRVLDPRPAEQVAGAPLPSAPSPAADDLAVPVASEAPHGVIAVDRAWVRDRFGTPEVELVDLRSRDAWAAGHLPHSLPFDFGELLEDDGGWPDPAVARRTLGRLGPRPSTPVDLAATMVVYSSGVGASGDDGGRLGLAYLLLRMMGVEAAVYPGGWEEWRAEPSSPVVRVVGAEEVRKLLTPANPELADRPVPGVTLLDVRGERDHFVRHLPGSIVFPSRSCPESDWSVVPEPPSGSRLDAPLVFYCYGRSCIRSRDCSTAAARAGFREVLWFRDGVPAWHEAGLPFYRSGEPGETATRLP